ncbi:MAG: hypothetical protein K0R62_5705 [Nonomuraea muscovyensis]|nr:hypothetical protein [Nonomuraea muscovyensis]
MSRSPRHALVRVLASASLAGATLTAGPTAAAGSTAAAGPTVRTAAHATTGAVRPAGHAAVTGTARTAAGENGGGRVRPVPGVREPEGAAADVPREPSLALRDPGDPSTGPVAPQVTTPAGPELVREIERDAAERVGAGGPDTRDLLPDTGRARPLRLRTPATGVLDALGIARSRRGTEPARPATSAATSAATEPATKLTYRLCVRAADVPVSCSATRPVATPAAADVTGDGAPDLAAVLTPTAAPREAAAGLAFAVRRLPGAGDRVRALVWAEYDGRVAVGFDGLRGGAELSEADRGTFTVDLSGRRVTASVRRTGPGASAAVVAGLIGRSAVSLRQTPATEKLTVDAALDPTAEDAAGSTSLTLDASAPAVVEAVAVQPGRYTRALLDRMPVRARVELTRGVAARVRITGPSAVRRAELRTYHYRDGRLSRAASVEVRDAPPSLTAAYEPRDGTQTLTVDSGRTGAGSARLLYYDRASAGTVLRAELDDLPAKVRLLHDPAAHRLVQTTGSPLGGLAVVLQRGGGALASPAGHHLTMIKNGSAVGVSARLAGLSGFDITYGARPRARLDARTGGRPFVGAASLDGAHLARLEVSNLPRTLEVDLDPAAGRVVYRADGAISRARAAYTGLKAGPTLDGTVLGLRGRVSASWALGERPTAEVETSAPLRTVRLYAGRAHASSPHDRNASGQDARGNDARGEDPQGTDVRGEDVRAEVHGLRGRARLVADTAARTLSWTATAPVTSVSALARARVHGRYVRAAARVTGVPARFDASWDASGYRFRGLSGPLGSAAVAVTNHDGAKAPTGPHLAAHYDETSGDLDASVLVKGLSRAEFGPAGAAGFAADFRAARQRLALDTDVTRGDVRFGVLGRLGPVPGRLAVSVADGALTYTGSRLDVRASAWLGKAAALRDLPPAPVVAGGVSLVDGGCAPGTAGCAPGPFCAGERGCFAVRGHLDVTGLPERITVDAARKTFTFSGYRPASRRLDLYLSSTVLAPAPVRARASITGLPRTVTGLSLGPFEVAGNAVQAAYRVEPAATLGSLTVHAEAGGLRGRLAVDPVPATLSVQAAYGPRTRVRVRNSAAVKRLSAAVTVPGAGTGEARFGDVPAVFGVDADAAAGDLRVPAVTYRAEGGASTLDGRLAVQGGLVDRTGRLGALSLAVTDLAADTTVRLTPGQGLDLVSKPVPTKQVELHAGVTIGPVARQRFSAGKEIPYTTGFLSYHLGGDLALGRSTIDDLSLTVRRLSWLRVRPGRVPFGLKAPAGLGYVAPAFEGDYGRLDLAAKGVDLRPDVRLDVRLSRKVGEDVFRESVRLGAVTSLALRRYDQRMRRIGASQELSAAGVRLACLTVDARPGFAAAQAGDVITLRGSDGPQMVSLLDPGGRVPDYAVDLLTHFMSPFPGAEWKVSGVKAGRCPRPDAGDAR